MSSRVAVERRFFQEHPGEVFDEAWHNPKFQVEQYLDALPEMRLLYPEHWAEIALDRGTIPLAPDYASYENMAKAGVLHVVTARVAPSPRGSQEDALNQRSTLVGYHLSMIHPHLHYKTSLTCFTDVFYLRPEHRKGMTGYRMLKFFRDSVKERGVQKIYMGTKLSHDIGPLLERLGFKPIERLYTQVFS